MATIDARQTMGALLAATVVLAACGRSDHNAATPDTAMGQPMAGTSTGAMSSATTTPAGSTAMASPGTDTTHLTDANILAKEEGGDSAEVALATYMRAHASSAGVKSFATMLVDDHGKSLRQTKALASKLNVTPQAPPNDTTAQGTAHVMDRLKTLKGTALDTAFVNHEVSDHQHDIEDAHMMASAAQNAQVKSLIQQSIPVLQKHLDRAQQLAKQK